MTSPESPAALLHRAASAMRERAEAATPGPWRAHEEDSNWYVSSTPYGLVSTGINADWSAPDHVMIERDRCDAEHVASWHPLVALAVAEWLDLEARMAGLRGNSPEGQTFHALKVARAFLGELEAEGAQA